MSYSLTWYGQASFLISSNNTSIIIDPFFSDSIAKSGFIRLYDSPVKKGELKVDYVISTHNHGDHTDVETLRDYIEFKQFYGPDSCVQHLKNAGFSADSLFSFNRGDNVKLGDFILNAVHAEHTPDSIGIVAECGDCKLYFTGDSLMNPELGKVKSFSPDILISCINGRYGNMNWQDAFMLAHRLEVKLAIPMHYDLFAINTEDPSLFVNAFDRSSIKGKILERCKAYDIASLL